MKLRLRRPSQEKFVSLASLPGKSCTVRVETYVEIRESSVDVVTAHGSMHEYIVHILVISIAEELSPRQITETHFTIAPFLSVELVFIT